MKLIKFQYVWNKIYKLTNIAYPQGRYRCRPSKRTVGIAFRSYLGIFFSQSEGLSSLTAALKMLLASSAVILPSKLTSPFM